MNQRVTKRIRKRVYGDIAHRAIGREFVQEPGEEWFRTASMKRREYKLAKKEYYRERRAYGKGCTFHWPK